MQSDERGRRSVGMGLLWTLVMKSNVDTGQGSHSFKGHYYTGHSIKYGICPQET